MRGFLISERFNRRGFPRTTCPAVSTRPAESKMTPVAMLLERPPVVIRTTAGFAFSTTSMNRSSSCRRSSSERRTPAFTPQATISEIRIESRVAMTREGMRGCLPDPVRVLNPLIRSPVIGFPVIGPPGNGIASSHALSPFPETIREGRLLRAPVLRRTGSSGIEFQTRHSDRKRPDGGGKGRYRPPS